MSQQDIDRMLREARERLCPPLVKILRSPARSPIELAASVHKWSGRHMGGLESRLTGRAHWCGEAPTPLRPGSYIRALGTEEHLQVVAVDKTTLTVRRSRVTAPWGDRLPEHVCLGPGPCPHDECRKNQEASDPFPHEPEEIIEIDEDGVVHAPETKVQLHAHIKELEKDAEREARIWREAAELVGGDIRGEALAALETDGLFMAGEVERRVLAGEVDGG